jgi:hypothetical protein
MPPEFNHEMPRTINTIKIHGNIHHNNQFDMCVAFHINYFVIFFVGS